MGKTKNLQAIRMLKVLHNLKQNRWKFTIGLLVLAIGLCLLATPDYFFWPPQYKNLMNDDGIDVFIIISGLLLILYSLSNLHSNKIASVLLAISAAIVASITFIEIIHWQFAGMFRNNLTIVLAIFAVVVIFLVSYDRSIDSQGGDSLARFNQFNASAITFPYRPFCLVFK